MSSEEEDIFCSRCGNQTEQALVLLCEHSFCFNCALEILKSQDINDYDTHQFIKCILCQNSTILDPDTIRQILNENNEFENLEKNKEKELNKLYIKDNNNYDYINKKNIIDNNKKDENGNQLINKNGNNQNEINNNISTSELNIINDLANLKNLCKEHSEPLTYLCLDCLSNCICSECVIHGIHRNHEVLNIKKAYPLIYRKLEDLSKYANEQKKSILLINETISKKKKYINDMIDRCKSEIHNIFEQIKIKLDNKEKEIVNNATSILTKNIEELDNHDNNLIKHSNNLDEIIVKINNILSKKDELNTINYFCENNNNILEQCDLQKISFFPNLDTLHNIKIEPNKSSFNEMIKGINNFNFNITNIKGFDINIKKTNKIKKNIKNMNFQQLYNNNTNNIISQIGQNNFSNMNNKNDIYYTEIPIDYYGLNNKIPMQNNNSKKLRPRTAKPSKRKNKINNSNNINNMNIERNENNFPQPNNQINYEYNY